MNTRLASLDATLEQLALEFAQNITAAAMTAPIAELRTFLSEASTLPQILREAIARLAPPDVARFVRPEPPTKVVAAPAPRPVAKVTRVVAVAKPPAVRPSSTPPRRTRSAVVRARPDPVEDADLFANAITDPSILLERIGAGPSASVRTARPETELLRAPAPTPRASEAGPALRPGERLQRTSGGNMVLRRGGK